MNIRMVFCLSAVMACLVAAPTFAATYSSVSKTVTGTQGGTIDATATCPAGSTVTGGGYDFDDNNNNAQYSAAVTVYSKGTSTGPVLTGAGFQTIFIPKMVVVRSYSTANGWSVAGYMNQTMNLTIYAYCATP